MTFRQAQRIAKERGLILQRIDRKVDGERYRFEVYDNNSGMSGDFQTLNEAIAEIFNGGQADSMSPLALY